MRKGTAAVFAHHGEVMQGVFYSADGSLEHALVTLPCRLFRSQAKFSPVRSGPLRIHPPNRRRSLLAARLTLEVLGRADFGGYLCLESTVPVCWGCGSSTTDVVASIGAVADAFGATLTRDWIARMAVAAETASDPLMYSGREAVLFAQRRGSPLVNLGGPLPPVRVLGFNTGDDRGVETLRLSPISYSSWEIEAFRPMLGLLRRSIEIQDSSLLGRVAMASTLITQHHRPKRFMAEILTLARTHGVLGVQVAHSGTVAGLLFRPDESSDKIGKARSALSEMGLNSWEFISHTDSS